MVTIDIALVLLFFVVIFYLGLRDRKSVTIEDFWVNSRKTTKYTLIATIASSFVGAGAIMSNASITHAGGGLLMLVVAASFFVYLYIFSRFFAAKIKAFGDKHKAYTIPDFLAVTYDGRVRIAGAGVLLVTWSLFLAVQLLGAGTLASTLLGVDPVWATIFGGLLVIAYTTIGGMKADIRTDVFQFLVLFVLIFVFLPLLVVKAGGLGVITQLPAEFLSGEVFAPWYVALIALLTLGVGALTSADLWQRAYAGDSKKDVRSAMAISSAVVLVFFVFAVLAGIYGKVVLPDVDSSFIIPELIKVVLPTGLLGLVLAGLFAALMSSADTVLLVMSMTLINDLYQKTLKKKMSDTEILRVSRWTTAIGGSVALAVALVVFNLVHLSIEAVSFAVVLAPSVIFGFYTKKPSARAAFWSILLGFLTIFGFLFIVPIQAFIPGLFVSLVTYGILHKLDA